MDPLTHYLSAKLTLHIFLKEKTDRLMSLFILAAVFPDIDYVMRIFGRAVYLKYHRGITHSFVGIFFLSILLAFLFSIKDKKNFLTLFLLAFISMLIHILFDWTNSYGTQLFLPFSDKRAALDSVFILDIYILAWFAISLVLIYFSQKHKFKISLFFTSMTVIYIIIRIFLNSSAVSQIKKMPVDNDPVISVGAFPDILLPHNFKCVIETKKKYYTFDYNSLKKERHILTEYIKKFDDDEYLKAAKESYLGKVFYNFARYPYYYIEPRGDKVLVEITDLRFKYSRNRGGFTASILISKDKKVEKEKFRFR